MAAIAINNNIDDNDDDAVRECGIAYINKYIKKFQGCEQ